MKDGRTSDEPPGSQIMVARPKSLVPGPNSSSAASPFTGSQHLLKALRKRVKVSLGILRNSRADLSIRLSWCRACQSRPVRVTHRLESRMREIRTSGSEGGVGSIPHSYLYNGLNSRAGPARDSPARGCSQGTGCSQEAAQEGQAAQPHPSISEVRRFLRKRHVRRAGPPQTLTAQC